MWRGRGLVRVKDVIKIQVKDNPKPINAFKKFGGEIIKTYRIYGKEISEWYLI